MSGRTSTGRSRRRRSARGLSPSLVLEIARVLAKASLVRPIPDASPFDMTIGKLVFEALTAGSKHQMSESQREQFAAEADKAGFILREHLEPKSRGCLGAWNQQRSRHPDQMITTFSRALKSTAGLRRGVLRAMYRAKDSYVSTQVTQSA
jgi:hypothetical protein